MLAAFADRWTVGWRGLALAALVALIAALPGLALPVTDREEALTAQASAQMLESGDFVVVNFQDRVREGQAIGVHWPQAASVAAFSSAPARAIWAYRIPSLIGAMLAALACAWGARAFWDERTSTLAGAGLGVTLLAATIGGVATADALAGGTTALVLAALARLYAAGHGLKPAGRHTRAVFWAALAAACLSGGWPPAALTLLTGAALWISERKAPWARSMGWSWGLISLAAVLGPWLVAITVTTDGGFWRIPAPPHRALPGGDTLAIFALSFPLLALVPAAAVLAWRERGDAGVRFAFAWLVAGLLLFEARPAANIADALLFFPPLAWLCAAAWRSETGKIARFTGVLLSLAGGAALVGIILYLLRRFGGPDDAPAGAVAGVLLVCAGLAAAFAVLRGRLTPLVVAGVLAMAGQTLLVGVLAPGLELLWPSKTIVEALHNIGLNPADGIAQGPVTVAGYAEPSLIFSLGAKTIVGDAEAAALAIAEDRPVILEAGLAEAFQAALGRRGLHAQAVARASGLDYADNRPVNLIIWRRIP